MHVLMLCALEVWALPGSGGAPSLYRTLRAYRERGHRVTFVTSTVGANALLSHGRLRGHAPPMPPYIPGVTFERFHLPSLQEWRLPLPGLAAKADQKLRFALLFPRLAARRAEAVLAGEKVDVLYAYEVHGALAARKLRRGFRLPTVARFQGTVMHPALGSALARLRQYEEVLALRPPTQDEGAEQRGALGIADEAFVLLTASRLAAWKRVDRAIAALPQIVRSVPNALLLAVGDGEERASLERLARELGVANSVRFAGAVPP